MLRDERQFLNLLLVEQPNGDFAHTIVRQLLFDGYQLLLWETLAGDSDPDLAGIAGRALKEARYHFRHSSSWVIRLGDGTEESHRRAQTALDELWRYTDELFLDGAVADRTPWDTMIGEVLAEAGLVGSRRAVPKGRRPARLPQRASRFSPRRDAMDAAVLPGAGVVMVATLLEVDQAIAAVGAVVDPEIPVLTIADLGILRDVVLDDGRLLVTITPTYSGCPAMRQIESDVKEAARAAGFDDVEVRVVHNPPWTTDWISPKARHALAGFGITPPTPLAEVTCPRCARLVARRLPLRVDGMQGTDGVHRLRRAVRPFQGALRCRPLSSSTTSRSSRWSR